MSDVTITAKQNGPLVVSGPIHLLDADGNAYTLDKPVFGLCRCGHSANKPFCDGSHNTAGFVAEERANQEG
jgi:CDGSH-type Zn-finger protein